MNANTILEHKMKKNVPDLRAGQVVRVHERIVEGGKERIQVFEGLVLSVRGGRGLNGTFTVRKMGAGNVGVERTFVLHMPTLTKVEVLRQEKVRRAKLYFIREQVNKKTKKRRATEKNVIFDLAPQEEVEEEVSEEIPAEEGVEEMPVEEQATEEAPQEETTEEAPVAEEAEEKKE